MSNHVAGPMPDGPRDILAEAPPGCPFAADGPPGSPFALDPKPSILHLMIWAACVAVFMSAYHTLTLGREEAAVDGVRIVIFGLWGLVGGAYLAVFPLMVTRWAGHQTFPRSGGEILWILGAMGVVQMLLYQMLFAMFEGSYFAYSAMRVLAGLFVWLPAYLLASYASRGHWRVYFLLVMVAGFVSYILQTSLSYTGGTKAMLVEYLGHIIVFTAVLLLMVWLDLRNPRVRYPWPHWAGIIIGFAINGVAMLSYAYQWMEAVVRGTP